MSNIKISSIVSEGLPEFIREDYPNFIRFIDAYYEFMEQENLYKRTHTEVVSSRDAIQPFMIGKNPSDFQIQTDSLSRVVNYNPALVDSQNQTDNLIHAVDYIRTYGDVLTSPVDQISITMSFIRALAEGGYVLESDYVDSSYFMNDVGFVETFVKV